MKEKPNIPFGNVNIIILGDWAQLFPVNNDPLFLPNKRKDASMTKEGKFLFNTFKDCINLNEIMRQNYTEPDHNIHNNYE